MSMRERFLRVWQRTVLGDPSLSLELVTFCAATLVIVLLSGLVMNLLVVYV